MEDREELIQGAEARVTVRLLPGTDECFEVRRLGPLQLRQIEYLVELPGARLALFDAQHNFQVLDADRAVGEQSAAQLLELSANT